LEKNPTTPSTGEQVHQHGRGGVAHGPRRLDDPRECPPSATEARNQSLAEAHVAARGGTDGHYHRRSEELYLFFEAPARISLGGEPRKVGPGDCVMISPGTPHRVVNTGGGDLRFLCCGPPYSGEDTVFSARAERE